jgi:hypothetical protein
MFKIRLKHVNSPRGCKDDMSRREVSESSEPLENIVEVSNSTVKGSRKVVSLFIKRTAKLEFQCSQVGQMRPPSDHGKGQHNLFLARASGVDSKESVDRAPFGARAQVQL